MKYQWISDLSIAVSHCFAPAGKLPARDSQVPPSSQVPDIEEYETGEESSWIARDAESGHHTLTIVPQISMLRSVEDSRRQ